MDSAAIAAVISSRSLLFSLRKSTSVLEKTTRKAASTRKGNGSSFRSADDGYAGGWPLANEWDRYISAEAPTTGLPKPSASDLDESLDAADLQSEHNALWNWFGAVSWTREPYAQRESARCCRGYRSARYFYLNTQSHRHEDIGWRPVLEALE